MTFGVETQETTAKLVLDTNSQTMNNIITTIMSAGIIEDEISTSRFNIYPIYEGYEDPITKRWKQELTGYRLTNTIAVETTNLTMAADVIDGAVNSGANKVESVSFKLSPEKHLQLKDELIETAILNAKFKAENALAPLDYSITGVKAVSLSEFGATPPIPFYESAFDGSFAAKSTSTPIFSSDQEVSTTASVIFTIGRTSCPFFSLLSVNTSHKTKNNPNLIWQQERKFTNKCKTIITSKLSFRLHILSVRSVRLALHRPVARICIFTTALTP